MQTAAVTRVNMLSGDEGEIELVITKDALSYHEATKMVINLAREEAEKLNHSILGPEFLLLGLMRGGGFPSRVLTDFGAELDALRAQIQDLLGMSGVVQGGALTLPPQTRRVMERAAQQAHVLETATVTPKHILLAIIESRDMSDVAYRLLMQLTGDVEAVRWRLLAGHGDDDGDLGGEEPIFDGDTGVYDVDVPDEPRSASRSDAQAVEYATLIEDQNETGKLYTWSDRWGTLRKDGFLELIELMEGRGNAPKAENLVGFLNQLGVRGWQLCGVTQEAGRKTLIFQRPT
ncbi:MAG: hypothetical protein JSV66_04710 [Trueperaceae bacterium]|nr:MAG: hypothetical protein JSV66_04710 [Trueperaceae bacterium]